MIQSLEPLIEAHPFFKDLDPEFLQCVVGCACNRRFEKGQYLFREGEAADEFHLIRDGRVALEVNLPGRGASIIQTMGTGEVVGWSWLFPPYRWHFDARADTQVRTVGFDGRCLRGKCEQNHDLGYEVVLRAARILSERLQSARLQMLDIYRDGEG